jgi:hypothetical protein
MHVSPVLRAWLLDNHATGHPVPTLAWLTRLHHMPACLPLAGAVCAVVINVIDDAPST